MVDVKFILEAIPNIIKAVPVTVFLAVGAAGLGWFIGIFIALARKSKTPVISPICAVFVSFMRGVPIIILLYIAYYALPIFIYNYGQHIGIEIDVTVVPPVLYALIALTLDQAAYSSEIFRAALTAVDENQMEAAYSVGMTKFQGLIRIVLPQALAIAMPNLGGLFLGLVKGTALAYYVGVYEITATANLLALPALNFIEAYVMTTAVYEIISIVINKTFSTIEHRLKRYRAGAMA